MKRDYEIHRDSFVLYTAYRGPLSGLTDEQLGRLFRLIFDWQAGEDISPGQDLQIAWGFIENQFRTDDAKYLERCRQNSENIRKRWDTNEHNRIRSNKSNTKHTDNDNDNDNDNDSIKGGKTLELPFSDPAFVDAWNELRTQPKWKKKTIAALRKNLFQLSAYPVEFAVELINNAIAGNYQGLTFPDTPARFETWKRTHAIPTRQERPISNIDDLYKD